MVAPTTQQNKKLTVLVYGIPLKMYIYENNFVALGNNEIMWGK